MFHAWKDAVVLIVKMLVMFIILISNFEWKVFFWMMNVASKKQQICEQIYD
jgi:hypothetical protein